MMEWIVLALVSCGILVVIFEWVRDTYRSGVRIKKMRENTRRIEKLNSDLANKLITPEEFAEQILVCIKNADRL